MLAAVFLTAGVAKLADPVELTVAVALLPAAFSQWAALGALVLLVLFVAGIANVMVRGRGLMAANGVSDQKVFAVNELPAPLGAGRKLPKAGDVKSEIIKFERQP